MERAGPEIVLEKVALTHRFLRLQQTCSGIDKAKGRSVYVTARVARTYDRFVTQVPCGPVSPD